MKVAITYAELQHFLQALIPYTQQEYRKIQSCYHPEIPYKLKPIQGGNVKQYALEVDMIGKNLPILVQVNKRITELLDDPRGEKIIKDENVTIVSSALVSGGGSTKNPETNNFILISYFKLIIKGVF